MFLRSVFEGRRMVAPMTMMMMANRTMATESTKEEPSVVVVSGEAPDFIGRVRLNRVKKRNALNEEMWDAIGEAFSSFGACDHTRVVVLDAIGGTFSAGIDTSLLFALAPQLQCGARNGHRLRKLVSRFQASFSAVEKCDKPVIAAIHGKCIGAGIDLVSACDIRFCTKDSSFSIKEVAVGLAADVGTLQRLPKVCGNQSLLRELAFTGRDFGSSEAKELGMVSRVFETPEEMEQETLRLAREIASHSPIAVTGTKQVLNFSRDHTVDEGLQFVANWNMAMLQSSDMLRIAQSAMSKTKPVFPPLNSDQ